MGVLRNYVTSQLQDGKIVVKLLPKASYGPGFRLFVMGLYETMHIKKTVEVLTYLLHCAIEQLY